MNENPGSDQVHAEAFTGPEITVLVCDYYIREVQAAIAELGLEGVRCRAFPARCGRPPVSRQELAEAAGAEARTAGTLVFGGCCVEGLEKGGPQADAFSLFQLPQCFELVAGKTFIENQIKQGGFLVTPGWLADWRQWMEKNGFDRQTARAFFAESISGIVLLDTGTDAAAGQNLESFAGFVDRPQTVMPVGIDVFKVHLHRRILMERQVLNRQQAADREREQQKEQADFAMALDLLSELPKATSEQEAFEKTRAVFDMLFAPGQLLYAEMAEEGRPQVWPLSGRAESFDPSAVGRRMAEALQNNRVVREADGFMIRMASRSHVIRGLQVRGIAFPQYLDRYVQIAQAIADVCSLAIDNARGYEKLKDSENRLRELATTDSLTRVANRAHFMEKAEQEVRRAGRYDTAFTLIIMDVDHFKQINDTYGHPSGDGVLAAIAAHCARQLRSSDLFGRIGGEEFAAGLIEADLGQGLEVADRIRQCVAEASFEGRGKNVHCTVSIGVAAFTGPSDTLDTILIRADEALYQAKHQGRNRVVAAGES